MLNYLNIERKIVYFRFPLLLTNKVEQKGVLWCSVLRTTKAWNFLINIYVTLKIINS